MQRIKLILTGFFVFALAASAYGQIEGYVLQVTTELDAQGKCQNWITMDNAQVTVEMAGADPRLYTEAELPDHDPREDDDAQDWYIYAPKGTGGPGVDVCYLVTFSAQAAGIPLPQGKKNTVYWFRYSKDGTMFSQAMSTIIQGPKPPVKK